MRKTKIVGTIGPASRQPEMLGKLVAAGLDVARFNLSHGGWDAQREAVAAVRRVGNVLGKKVAILLDTRGPEVRLGNFPDGGFSLAVGAHLTLERAQGIGTPEGSLDRGFFVCAGETDLARTGDRITVGDGEVVMEVERVEGDRLNCRTVVGGRIVSGKKLTFPRTRLSLPALTPEDVADIERGVEQDGVDWIALSFTRGPEDVRAARAVVEGAGGKQWIMAKIENRSGVENLLAVLDVADGVMVARGDLGLEYSPEEVPILQKRIIREANLRGKPVVTATQMLETMVKAPRPTRAEASDAANAILDGTDAVMLSEETAVGDFPLEAVAFLASLAQTVERAFPPEDSLGREISDATRAISRASCNVSTAVGAAAIVTATSSGHTARQVAMHRPNVPIIAVTPFEEVARRLQMVWGVLPWVGGRVASADQVIDEASLAALASGLVREGEKVVITAGVPVGITGTTNMIKVQTVGCE